MRHTLPLPGRCLAAVLFTAIGLGVYGCGDSASVSEPAELGNLSVSEGELQPPFTPATTSYTVQLSPDKASTTITASPRVAGDTIRIDNQPTTSQTVTLGSPGAEQSVSIVVTDSGAGGASKSYTVRVRRDAEDNSLLALSVSSGILSPSPFEKDTLDYTVNGVDSSATRITISATKSDPASIMQIGSVTVPAGTPSGQATVDLGSAGSTTPVEIVVSRPSGSSRTYNVSINRGPSDNNNLGGINISPGSLSPAFRANRTAYTVNLPATLAGNVTSVRITPRLQDTAAKMTVNGQDTDSGQAQSTPLPAPGSRVSNSIIVIAQNNTSKIYTVDVVRDALGGNNNLQSLAVSPGSLSPTFNANTARYTVNVGSGVNSVTVTPRPQDTNATMTVNGQATTSGQNRSVTLNGAGSNTLVNVVVTAPNSTQKIYTITVIKAALGGNNNLQSLAVSPGSLSPTFNANTTSYTVDVGSGVNSVTVTPRPQDTNATMTVNGQATTSGQNRSVTLNGAGSNTLVNVVVTAPNGTPRLYTVSVSREALGGNNNLQGLAVSPGTLNPTFNANRIAYTVNVGSSVAALNVTARLQDTNASMTINGQGTSSGQARSISLDAPGSSTTIEISVAAPNGQNKTYLITANRTALSGDNDLSALSVTPGTLAPPFAAGTQAYTVNVASGVTSVNVSATKSDTNAVLSGDVPNQGQAAIPLDGPGTSKDVSIIVTASNGTSKTYTIGINRAEPSAPPAPGSAPDLISADDSCPRDAGTNECLPGTSDTDNITNVATPSFTVAQPGSGETPHLYVDGTKVKEGFDQGATTLTPSSPLDDGVHSITSTVSNAGGESSPSPSLSVTIDTAAPGTPTP